MASYDVEMFLDDLKTLLNANMNTKIAALNTEKNDGITLKTIDSNAYILQSMDTTVPNYDPYVFYGIQEIESIGIPGNTANKYTITIAVILADPMRDSTTSKRMFRYQRALSEVLHEKYGDIGDKYKTRILSLEPIALTDLDSSNAYRAIGVNLEVTLA